MGSPAVIAESAFRRVGVSPQPAAAVLRGFQPVDQGYRTLWGAGDRSAEPPNRGAPGSAASKLRAAPGLRPADPRSPRPEGTRGCGLHAGSLRSHFCASARWLLLLPGGGSSQGRALQTGRQLAAPATPPRGGDSHARYSVRSCSVGAGALPALRPRVHEPSSRAESAAAPCAGLPAEGGGGGSRGFLGSFCPEEPALARLGPPEGRGDTATDTCLQGSAPARARRSEQVRLLAAGWEATPAPHSRAPPSAPPLLQRSRGTGSPGSLPQSPRVRSQGCRTGQAWRAQRKAPGSR